VTLQCHISGDANACNHYSKFANLLYHTHIRRRHCVRISPRCLALKICSDGAITWGKVCMRRAVKFKFKFKFKMEFARRLPIRNVQGRGVYKYTTADILNDGTRHSAHLRHATLKSAQCRYQRAAAHRSNLSRTAS